MLLLLTNKIFAIIASSSLSSLSCTHPDHSSSPSPSGELPVKTHRHHILAAVVVAAAASVVVWWSYHTSYIPVVHNRRQNTHGRILIPRNSFFLVLCFSLLCFL